MAASQKTTNYKLAIYEESDILEPLTDFNGNMNIIDSTMKANATAAQSANESATSAESAVESMKSQLTRLQSTVESLQEQVAGIKTLKAGDSLQLRANNTVASVTYN